MPRHNLKAYTTVLARIPQALAAQVKQYASQHRCTVSELIRDGLEMRLEAGDVPGRSTGRSADHGDEGLHKVLHTLSPLLLAQMQDMIRTTVTEVLQGHTSLPQPDTHGMPPVLPLETPSTAPTGEGSTEVVPLVPPLTPVPQMTEGHTTVIPLVPTIQQHAEGITEILQVAATLLEPAPEVLQGHTSLPQPHTQGMTEVLPIEPLLIQSAPEVLHGDTPYRSTGQAPTPQAHAPSTEQGMTEVLHDPPDFDATRFALGELCINQHEYQETGQTLYRLPKYACPQCDAARARERRARQKAASVQEG